MNEDSKPFNQFLCLQLTETEVSFQHGSNQRRLPGPRRRSPSSTQSSEVSSRSLPGRDTESTQLRAVSQSRLDLTVTEGSAAQRDTANRRSCCLRNHYYQSAPEQGAITDDQGRRHAVTFLGQCAGGGLQSLGRA